MYGWQARSCTNLHGMYRWFGVVPQGCVVLFPFFFVVLLRALGCDFLSGVLRTILLGIMYEDLVPLWLVTLPPNLP
jgi:hypothetical protein